MARSLNAAAVAIGRRRSAGRGRSRREIRRTPFALAPAGDGGEFGAAPAWCRPGCRGWRRSARPAAGPAPPACATVGWQRGLRPGSMTTGRHAERGQDVHVGRVEGRAMRDPVAGVEGGQEGQRERAARRRRSPRPARAATSTPYQSAIMGGDAGAQRRAGRRPRYSPAARPPAARGSPPPPRRRGRRCRAGRPPCGSRAARRAAAPPGGHWPR